MYCIYSFSVVLSYLPFVVATPYFFAFAVGLDCQPLYYCWRLLVAVAALTFLVVVSALVVVELGIVVAWVVVAELGIVVAWVVVVVVNLF